MRGGGMFDTHDFAKRIRRFIDGNHSYRKLLILLVICGALLLYLGPSVAQWLFASSQRPIEAFEDQCINERLASAFFDAAEYNAIISPSSDDHSYLPYVGNGVFGIPVTPEAWLYIKHGRTLSLRVPWQPILTHPNSDNTPSREATVTHLTTGIVHRYQCFREGYHVEFQYYAHRSLDRIFVQEIKIANPLAVSQEVPLKPQTSMHWRDSGTEAVQVQVEGLPNYEYTSTSGFVSLPGSDKIVAVAVVYRSPPKTFHVTARSFMKLQFLTSVHYSEPVSSDSYIARKQLLQVSQKKALEGMKRALVQQQQGLKEEHTLVWQSYWHAGIRISNSKAKGAINGHKINSTMYYVLSQVPAGIPDVEKDVANNEGCYRGHHTLDAPRLWQDTSTIEGVNDIVGAWLVTLEKQGCHHLMVGGPAAVQQAIVLSLGSLRFSNQHLEFNIDPQYLHRDYFFRRISYGNVTHLNISVMVGEDNRAVLGVALDRSDTVYYGCDAGCLDSPVPLSQSWTNFPVKLTKPLTAILYITSDQQHMQDLRKALHVHEVDEAPAHDHHVMALHKHGHRLGGLPTLFWISICFLIVVFHLFLCKLIISEYCDHQDRQRTRYGKP
ncbi:uncharacterized protein KIAA2013 homolog [Neodiprion lecontei]|uniref:Uncharacterized protein KIAA2013 homolog n=1 Tax=Neodiprion lecontei TaxID=441921 RepID=A0A6J0B7W5_NEOLC|nr:uncharacterized protein KIAA2013 homolog [Neodiprion lecontei]